MKNFNNIALVILMACFTVKSYSQGNVSIHIGPSFPVSDFASDDLDDEDAGGAAVGLNVGLQYVYPLSENGLGLFVGADFNYNELKKDVKEDLEELYESLGIINADIEYYKHINVPVTAGLNYSYQADDNIGVFANAGVALNFLKMTNMTLKASGQTETLEMDLATGIGFKIGGGILINKETTISIDYLGLGKHNIEGIVKSTGSFEEIDGELKVDIVTFTLGIMF